MALINCKHCGKEVSDKAKICPNCGGIIEEIAAESQELMVCEDCGSPVTKDMEACPKCGCPIVHKELGSNQQMGQKPLFVGISKKEISRKWIAIMVAGVAIFLAFLIVNGNILIGDNKIAYDILVEAADNFKNPSSVRLVSGRLGTEKDCLFCGISAKNGFGSRTTEYYFVKDGWILEEEKPLSFYKTKDELDIKKINKKLEKTLGKDD